MAFATRTPVAEAMAQKWGRASLGRAPAALLLAGLGRALYGGARRAVTLRPPSRCSPPQTP